VRLGSCASAADSPPPSLLGGALIVHYSGNPSVCRSPPSLLGGSNDWRVARAVIESFAPPSKLSGGGFSWVSPP
jgi:hypothetical protein